MSTVSERILAAAPVRRKRNIKNLGLPTNNKRLEEAKQDKNDASIGPLEIGIELKLDLHPEDLQVIEELGAGNGGTVSKVLHVPTRTIMAKKVSLLKDNYG
jgi:hypothetical protein